MVETGQIKITLSMCSYWIFTMFVLVKTNKIQNGVSYIYYLLMVWGFGAQGDPKSSHFWGESEIFKISSFGLSEVFF